MHNKGECVNQYEDRLKKLPSAAAYKEDDSQQENPVSWTMLYTYGTFGMTYTLPEFRRKGLATLVEVELCRKLLELGLFAFGDIEFHNTNSIEMHKKAGFSLKTKVSYAGYSPSLIKC